MVGRKRDKCVPWAALGWGSAGGGSALSLVLKGACGSVSVSPAFPEPPRMCPGVASRCLRPGRRALDLHVP